MLRLALSCHQVQCYSFRRRETGLFAWRIPSARLLGTFPLPSLWLLAEEMDASQRQRRSPQNLSLFPHCLNLQEQPNNRGRREFLRRKREEVQHIASHLQHVEKLMVESTRRLERKTPCLYSLWKHGYDQRRHQLERKVQWRSYLYHLHWWQFTQSAHFHRSQPSRSVWADQQAQDYPDLWAITQLQESSQIRWHH